MQPQQRMSREALDDIQGIVTSAYGHLDHFAILLLRVHDADGGRAWLRGVLDGVTSGAPWPVAADGLGRRRPPTTLNVGFTYAGLEALGLAREALGAFPTAFAVGMAARAAVLGDRGDSAPERWEFGGPPHEPVHVLALVYAPGERELEDRLEQLRPAGPGVTEIGTERGARLPDMRNHFGYAKDGLSQPAIEGVGYGRAGNAGKVPAGEFVLGHLNALGFYPPSPPVRGALGPLPPFPEGALPGCGDLGRNGSYLAYRKLHMDVAGFWRYIQRSAERDGGRDGLEGRMAWLAARLMGRWPSGAPVVLTPDVDDPSMADDNAFLYRPTDMSGDACPLGAHIRRANPRDSLVRVDDTGDESLKMSSQHRIIRRGVAYGRPLFPPELVAPGRAPVDLVDDGQPRGLHFLGVNADIKRQFEFLRQTWIDNPSFTGLSANLDPVVGANDGTGVMVLQARPVRRRLHDVPRFAPVRGGAYCFLPSLTALRYLAGA
jgi:deferrochelatase/peroxidase EfeB